MIRRVRKKEGWGTNMRILDFFRRKTRQSRSHEDVRTEGDLSKCQTLLVKALSLAAVGVTLQLEERYPELRTVMSRSGHPHSDWDFFFVAGGAALVIVPAGCPQQLREQVLEDLRVLNSELPIAIDNLKGFLQHNSNTTLNISSQVGVWILWNIGGECPSHDECKELAPAIGNLLQSIVHDCSTEG